MKVWQPGRTAIVRTGALITLLATCVFAPSIASASCGDYVTTRAQRAAHGQGYGHAMLSHETHPTPEAIPDTPRRERVPCSGPSCSGRRSEPIAPLPPVSLQSEPWCDTAWSLPCAMPEPVTDLFEHPLLWPLQCPTALCRPPRSLPV